MPPVTCPDHPRQWPSCLNGVCVVSAVGLTQLGFWAGVGAAFLLPAPGEPPSRPGGIQNLSGSQTVFRGALGARKDGARGDVGGCRCLCLLCGSPSYKEGLLEAWAGPCPPVPGRHRDDAQAEGSVSTKASPPPAPPSGSSDVPWEVGGLRPGAVLSQPLGSGEQTLSGGRRGGWIRVGGALGAGLHQAVFSQGYQDDRSYKQCRTSSPSSTGSVSLGRYTPTLRSPQHYSRPGTRPPRPLFPPREAGLLVAFPLMSLSLTLAPGETTDRAWDCQWVMESPSF